MRPSFSAPDMDKLCRTCRQDRVELVHPVDVCSRPHNPSRCYQTDLVEAERTESVVVVAIRVGGETVHA